ncbi:beta-1,3-galactosyl-O-glycosyl-glycoprotein beta-1,6-N-acetylglucosaminyltransferase 3-like [Hyperolius riggenbachi]|uniref:beta-1,3-galactosyl-O-glycosyl-glycoprotein beta-1,6-N-acetylglucosaminyltransferase 3-like n=1 Tax=Hyperolius riggenbachi TaxID=752182 RepID=UPI0035A3733B
MSLCEFRKYRCHQPQKLLILTMLCIVATVVVNYASDSCTLKDIQHNTDTARDHTCRDQFYELLSLRPNKQGELNCSQIIHGDSEAIKKALEINALTKKSRFHLNEQMFLNITRDCNYFKEFRRYVTIPMSKEEDDFPIAYSMVIHEKIEMFERLLRSIYAPQNIYCIHVDGSSSALFKEAVKAITSCFENVFVASKLEQVVYASWSRVQADFNCMEDLLKSNVQWKYLLNTCGTDFPLKTNAEIVRALLTLNGRNSMESERPSSGKQQRWKYHHEVSDHISRTSTEKVPPPIDSPMFTGNAYFVVSTDFVKYLYGEPRLQKFIDWAKDTYSPDEHLWATLNRMPGVPGSSPHNNKYDQTDMTAMARMVKWSYSEGNITNGAAYPICTGTHRRAVCVYGVGDLSWLIKQHHLFANKFDPEVDNIAIHCMEDYLRYKTFYRKDL